MRYMMMADTDLDLPIAQCTKTTPPLSLAYLMNCAALMASFVTSSSKSSQSCRLMYFTPSSSKQFFSSIAAFTIWVTLFRSNSSFLLVLQILSPRSRPSTIWAAWKLIWLFISSFSIQCPHLWHLVQIYRFLNCFSPAGSYDWYMTMLQWKLFQQLLSASCIWPQLPSLNCLHRYLRTELCLAVDHREMFFLMMKIIWFFKDGRRGQIDESRWRRRRERGQGQLAEGWWRGCLFHQFDKQ